MNSREGVDRSARVLELQQEHDEGGLNFRGDALDSVRMESGEVRDIGGNHLIGQLAAEAMFQPELFNLRLQRGLVRGRVLVRVKVRILVRVKVRILTQSAPATRPQARQTD